jgi:pilus assembly protein CpaE
MAGSMDEHGVSSVTTTGGEKLDLILAPTTPGDAATIPAGIVTELLQVLRRMYDVVVLDTPPALTEHVLAAFDASDLFVLLATLDVPALKNLKVSLDTLDLLGYPRESRLLVLNRADARVGLEIGDVEQTIGAPVGVQIPSSGDVPASINRGRLLVQEQPEHAVSRAVLAMATQVSGVSRTDSVSAGRGGLRSLLRRGGTR